MVSALAAIAAKPPDLVVLDANLRGRDCGIDVLRYVWERHSNIEAVTLSQPSWSCVRKSYVDAGALACFDKGVEIQQARDFIAALANARPATEDDAADACNVTWSSILECCDDDHRGDATVLEGWLRNKTPKFVRSVILASNAFSVVAGVDDEAVGFGSDLGTGEVTLCYVAPSVRFTSVGKALLAAIDDHAARAGVEALRLVSTRTARTFYLRNGFVPDGPAVLAFGVEGQPMRKGLGSKG